MKTSLLVLVTLWLAFAHPAMASGPWHAAKQNTSGWQFMTPDERIEHQRRMRSFKSLDECRAYQEEHHAQMAERALSKGITLQRHEDAGCEQLQHRGKLK